MFVDTALLPDVQKRQMGQLLGRLIAGGAGNLEIVVERSKIRWLRPATSVYSPDEERFHPVVISRPSTLEELIGAAWWETFVCRMAELMGHGWGRLTICVEHHRVQAIQYAPDVRPADCRPPVVQ